MLNRPVDISVVIPTYNRAFCLPEAIAAWARQTGPQTFEVIWADDGSSDGTLAILEEAGTAYPDRFRYLRGVRSGSPSEPRNKGIQAARASIVITVDDDIIPNDDFVFQHWTFHQQHPEEHIGAVGELFLAPEDAQHPMALFSSFPYHELRNRTDLDFLHFWAGNMSFKRSFMLRHGMYRVDQQLPFLEDMECGYRMMRSGYRLFFHPAACGRHLIHRMNNREVADKGYRTGQSQRRLLQLVPEVSVMRRFGILSPELGICGYLVRLARRALFRLIDNPLTARMLLLMGAASNRRSRVTDFYHRIIFRRNMVAGYYQAPRKTSALPTSLGTERA